MTVQALKLAPQAKSEETVEFLRLMMERAERGEVVGVTVVEERPNGMYAVNGTSTMSRLQTIGALFDAAVMRSGQ